MEPGGIVDEVLSVAREVEADLIAVGVHPPRVTNRVFDFGSAASLASRRVHCPRVSGAALLSHWTGPLAPIPDILAALLGR
jgi:hypothetical protein